MWKGRRKDQCSTASHLRLVYWCTCHSSPIYSDIAVIFCYLNVHVFLYLIYKLGLLMHRYTSLCRINPFGRSYSAGYILFTALTVFSWCKHTFLHFSSYALCLKSMVLNLAITMPILDLTDFKILSLLERVLNVEWKLYKNFHQILIMLLHYLVQCIITALIIQVLCSMPGIKRLTDAAFFPHFEHATGRHTMPQIM